MTGREYTIYGLEVSRSKYAQPRSVIARPEVSARGNLVLRVGREHDRPVHGTDQIGGWEQTEHVVMRPDEARSFVAALSETFAPEPPTADPPTVEEVAEKHASEEPRPDMLLFHDMVALAARIEDEAERCRDVASQAGVDAKTAHAAGIAHALLEQLESVMFEAANAINHQAKEMGLDASPARGWHPHKEACRQARKQARRSAARLVSNGAVSG